MRCHGSRRALVTFLATIAVLGAPTALADATRCVDLLVPACAYDGTGVPEPTCDEPGAQARHSGASVGEHRRAVHAGRWEDCSNDGASSSSFHRVGTWVFFDGLLVDVGFNHYSHERGSASRDLYVVHGGVPAAWYYEERSDEGDTCHLHVRAALSIGTMTGTPCLSDHAPGVLP